MLTVLRGRPETSCKAAKQGQYLVYSTAKATPQDGRSVPERPHTDGTARQTGTSCKAAKRGQYLVYSPAKATPQDGRDASRKGYLFLPLHISLNE